LHSYHHTLKQVFTEDTLQEGHHCDVFSTDVTDEHFPGFQSLQNEPGYNFGRVGSLAKSAGCSKPVAKERLNALVDNGIIQLVSMINPAAMGYQIEAMILLKSPPSQTIDVANQMSNQNFVRHASLTTGTWQIFISAQFWDSAHMREFLSDTLVTSAGVTDFEVIQIMKTLKFSMVFINTE